MPKKQLNDLQEPSNEPQRSKVLLYISFALTAIGAAMALAVTILIVIPDFIDISWSTLFTNPLTYILIGGLILVTAGLIMQRVITPPMKAIETEKLRSRLE